MSWLLGTLSACLLLIPPCHTLSKDKGTGFSPSFSADYPGNQFLLDGQPFRYISGSIHYFRIHPSQWADRLLRVRALGFNAIQYYIPWNFHEIYEGEGYTAWLRDFIKSYLGDDILLYTTDGASNSYLKCGAIPDTLTTVDFGPTSEKKINSSFEAQKKYLPDGGVQKTEERDKRMSRLLQIMYFDEQEKFKKAVEKWFAVLLPLVKPLLRKHNGPVLMIQVENEYGSYKACDRGYTTWLRDFIKSYLGDDTLLYTTDGASNSYLKCGAIPDTLATVDFGPTSEKKINSSFEAQKKYLPDDMYNLGANINFYMIHGGTNFGFWNGAETNAPCITSYDYFAPISEAGDITEKYLGIRSWIKNIPTWKNRPLDVPKNNPKKAFGEVNMVPVDDLSASPSSRNCISSVSPMSFEQINQPFGFVLYTRKMDVCGKRLEVKLLKDFGFVYLNNKHLGTLMHSYNGQSERTVHLEGCNPGDILTILVENQGRQTYETVNDYKGILSDVELDGKVLNGWTQCKVDITHDYGKISASNVQDPGKYGVYFGTFQVDTPTDTFLDTSGWRKGVAVVNGNNLGRYWASQGPQVLHYLCMNTGEIIFRELFKP
ncbi:glycosyl hydrolase family 35 [Necator americanus]|uniref:Glycosyl hydrolase family 35 n=1 Tax=Necator americanus TaxID=51031 RepID=W2TD91_NECAM|nr:glycosyl hydrolase family 35 [Necator americanus]ETN79569.1 glycosyl hydrolase family 35 [Necator americanus]